MLEVPHLLDLSSMQEATVNGWEVGKFQGYMYLGFEVGSDDLIMS